MNYPTPYRTSKSKNWYFNVSEKGKRRNLSTHCPLKRDALRYIREYIDSLVMSEYSIQTFADYSSRYYKWESCPKVTRALNEGKNMGQKHVGQCRRNLELYILTDPIFPQLIMKDIKRRDILDLRERLKDSMGSKINTLNKTIGTVKAIFAEAHFREDIENDPGAKIGNLKEDRISREVLTEGELKTMFQESPGYWGDKIGWDFFFILANTGMRSAELRALKWDKWDRTNQVIKIHRSWKGNTAETLGLPKWDKIRDIPVSDIVADIINSRPHYGEFIFCYKNGDRLGNTWITKRVRSAVKQAGLTLQGRNITAHCLRHSCNTYLLTQEINPVFVQAYLGWSKDTALTRTQEAYTHFRPEHIQDCPDTMAAIWGSTVDHKNIIRFPGVG